MITDGWSGYCGLPDHDHQPEVVGATPAHLVLTWIHRVFSNLKRWALGTFHGLRRAHLRRYLDEFVFRWNRRRHTATAFDEGKTDTARAWVYVRDDAPFGGPDPPAALFRYARDRSGDHPSSICRPSPGSCRPTPTPATGGSMRPAARRDP